MTRLTEIKLAIEALLLVAEDPLSKRQLTRLLQPDDDTDKEIARLVGHAINSLRRDSQHRAYELIEVGSGFRLQIRTELNVWVNKLWMQRPRKYSRALLETLALIAYRQPITRGEIEQVRGVAVSSYTMRTLVDRGWVRELGTKDLPGRPMMYGTTPAFLDHFSLRSLDDLPPLADLAELAVDELEEPEVSVQPAEEVSELPSEADSLDAETVSD